MKIAKFPSWIRWVSAPVSLVFPGLLGSALYLDFTEWTWAYVALACTYGSLGVCLGYMSWVLAAIVVWRWSNGRKHPRDREHDDATTPIA